MWENFSPEQIQHWQLHSKPHVLWPGKKLSKFLPYLETSQNKIQGSRLNNLMMRISSDFTGPSGFMGDRSGSTGFIS